MKYTFFTDRMKQLGVTKRNNKMDVMDPNSEMGMQFRKDHPIFREDKDGNIEIYFTTIDRNLISYEQKGDGKMSQHNAKWLIWKQKRYRQPKGDNKYNIPKGAGTFPFFAPLIQDRYEKKEKIKILYLTEGAFKAWLACLYGIHVVGLTSITHYRDSQTKKLHADIVKLIIECDVERVVVLWDADCLDISEKDLWSMTDITRRPKGFYSAAIQIRKLLEEVDDFRKAKKEVEEREQKKSKPYKPLEVFFAHIKRNIERLSSPKGLDDLLIAAAEKKVLKSVLKSANNLDKENDRYFFKLNITHESGSLKSYFKLDDVEKFYYWHSAIIQNEFFLFEKDIYEWTNQDGGQLRLKAPGWSKEILWVGEHFYVKHEVPTAYGDQEDRIIKHSVEDLKRRTGKKDFYQYLKDNTYHGFVNYPDHYNYQQTIENDKGHKYYNKYFPFKHRPKKGNYDTTLNFVKHIFGNGEKTRNGVTYKSWELGLDYIQILLESPTQMLPIIFLYSPENATGKSTFGNWLRFILGSNAIKVSNKDFKNDFNEHYSSKSLVICEETLLDKKRDSESLKDMSTSKHITVNTKGISQYQVDFFAKFIFMSNNTRMIYLEKYDERYWIIRVSQVKEKNPDLEDELKAEFPAFLYYLQKRKLKAPKEGRMWFHESLIKTEQFYETVKVNEPKDVKELRVLVKEYFMEFSTPELIMPIKDIQSYFFTPGKEINWIKEILTEYNLATQSKNEAGKTKTERGFYYTSYREINPQTGERDTHTSKVNWVCRGPWIFKRTDFIDAEEEDIPQESIPPGTQAKIFQEVEDHGQLVSQYVTNM